MQYSFVAVGAILATSAQAAVMQSYGSYGASSAAPAEYSSVVPVAYSASAPAAYTPTPVAYTSAAPPVYTTEVVTALTTYCPYATQLTHGGKTYTVSSATTLTISEFEIQITNKKPRISLETNNLSL